MHQDRLETAFKYSFIVGALAAMGRWLDGSLVNALWLRMETVIYSWAAGSRVVSGFLGSGPLDAGMLSVFRGSLFCRATWLVIDRFWLLALGACGALCRGYQAVGVFKTSRFLTAFTAWLKEPGLSVPTVALAVPLLPTKITLVLILLSLLGMLTTDKNGWPLSRLLRTPHDFPVFLFIVVLTVSAALSLDLRGSLVTWASYLLYIGFFYLVAARLDAEGLRRVILAFLSAIALLSLYGIYQYLVGVPAERAWVDQTTFSDLKTRVFSTLDNPNVLAEYLILTLPLALAAGIAARTWKERLFSVVVLGLGGVCLLLTMSRGGWVGFIFAMVVFATLKDRRALLLLIFALVMAAYLLPDAFLGRAASIVSMQESSNAYRFSIWLAVRRMVEDFWISGIGPGLNTFSLVYPYYSLAGGKALHAHNLFLQVLVEMGIVGLLSLLLLLWEFFRVGARMLVRLGSSDKFVYHRHLVFALMAGMGGYLLQGLTEHLWYSPRITITFWMVMGLMAAVVRLGTESGALTESGYSENC